MYKTAKEFYHKRNFDKAIELFKQCQNNINVQYFLYVCSIQADFASTQKLNMDTNLKAMIPFLIEQAKSEDSESCFILSRCYTLGHGVTANKRIAFEWCKKAATLLNEDAMVDLGWKYSHGLGVKTSYNQAYKWYSKAIELYNSPTAWCRIGYMYQFGQHIRKPDIPKAFDCYVKSAELGHPGGQDRLGWMYKYGCGCIKNYEKAFKYFQLSANGGNSDGQYCLGKMYAEGIGTQRDYKMAEYWYTLSANANNNYALVTLADMYQNGIYVEKNILKAQDLYARAAKYGTSKALSGNACAMRWLGYMYEFGKGVKKDYSKAIQCYQQAAEGKEIYAMCRLAQMHEEAKGVPQSYKIAFFWYKKASEQNNDYALLKLGIYYKYGYYVEKSDSKAIEYWERASQQKNPIAFYHLGNSYLNGEGVKHNFEKAKICFEKSIEYGYSCDYLLQYTAMKLNNKNSTMQLYIENLSNLNISSEQIFTILQSDLQKDFGKYWNKLQSKSKQFLTTGMFVYYSIFILGNNVYNTLDFSASITPMIKALEIELGKYFYYDYLKYLKEQKISPSNFSPSQPFIGINKYGKQIYCINRGNKFFSLGCLSHLFGLHYNTSKDILNQNSGIQNCSMDRYIIDYANQIFDQTVFSKETRLADIELYLIKLANETKCISSFLRNKAAHDSVMKIDDANLCSEWLIKVQKIIQSLLVKIYN